MGPFPLQAPPRSLTSGFLSLSHALQSHLGSTYPQQPLHRGLLSIPSQCPGPSQCAWQEGGPCLGKSLLLEVVAQRACLEVGLTPHLLGIQRVGGAPTLREPNESSWLHGLQVPLALESSFSMATNTHNKILSFQSFLSVQFMALSTFTVLCNHHHPPSQKASISPAEPLHALNSTPLTLPRAPNDHHSPFCLGESDCCRGLREVES